MYNISFWSFRRDWLFDINKTTIVSSNNEIMKKKCFIVIWGLHLWVKSPHTCSVKYYRKSIRFGTGLLFGQRRCVRDCSPDGLGPWPNGVAAKARRRSRNAQKKNHIIVIKMHQWQCDLYQKMKQAVEEDTIRWKKAVLSDMGVGF